MEREFTEEDANRLLPRLTELLTALRDAHERLGAAARATASNGSHGGGGSALTEGRDQAAAALQAVTDLGVTVRDAGSGLVDFPALRDGEPIFLCWRLGEERVAWWHPRDTGFAGRQPL